MRLVVFAPPARCVSLLLFLFVVGLGLAFPLRTAAAGDPEALIAHGIALREQGRDEEALAEFRKAYAMAPSPRAEAQMGLAEQALGMWTAAEEHVRAATAASADPWIAKNRAALAQALKVIEQHVGTLDVRGTAGAEIFVDGERAGVLPLARPLHLETGRRNVELRAPGYVAASRTVTISAGETSRETIELGRAPEAEPEAEPPKRAVAPAFNAPHDADNPPASPAAPKTSTGSTQRTAGFILAGVGGAALITGVVALIVRNGEVSAYNDDASCPGMSAPSQPAQCQSHINSADTWRTIAIAGLAGGAAASIGGVALVLTAPSGPHGQASISFSSKF